jgi:hypothetical protein
MGRGSVWMWVWRVALIPPAAINGDSCKRKEVPGSSAAPVGKMGIFDTDTPPSMVGLQIGKTKELKIAEFILVWLKTDST